VVPGLILDQKVKGQSHTVRKVSIQVPVYAVALPHFIVIHQMARPYDAEHAPDDFVTVYLLTH